MLGTENATVVRIRGTEVLNTKEYNKESFDLDQHVQEEEKSDVDAKRKFLKL